MLTNKIISFFSYVRIIGTVTIILMILISILSYQFYQTNADKIFNIATQNIKENAEIILKQIDESLENKMETIFANLRVISESSGIKSNGINAVNLLVSAQNTTNELTSYYGWTNKTGNIKWATSFADHATFNKYIGVNVSFNDQFHKLTSNLLPEITPILLSITNIPTIFVVSPILVTNIEAEYYTNDSNDIPTFQKYTRDKLFNQINTLQQQIANEKKFNLNDPNLLSGSVYAGINVDTMIKFLEKQVRSQDRSSISLFDENGSIVYSSYQGLDNLIINNQNNKDSINEQFDKDNQILLSQIKSRITNGETGSTDIIDKSGNVSTIAYSPISVNGKNIFYLMLDTSHIFAREVDNLILQQQNFAIGSIILIVVITVLVVFLMNIFNVKLKKIVEKRTRDLNLAIKNLEENNQMQKDFINVAAHELRTPTQSIAGYCEMIELLPENLNKYLQPIKRNTERLLILINNILNVTRIESKNFKVEKSHFVLNDCINSVKKEIELNITNTKDKKIKIIFNPKIKKSPVLFADKTKISQVISNLLINSTNFIDTEGEILITTEKQEVKESGKKKKEYVLVKIKDNGTGIDKEIIDKLFEKFITKSEQGTGLGLFISKKIIEMHGGTINGYNNPEEKGATFEFTIPFNHDDTNNDIDNKN